MIFPPFTRNFPDCHVWWHRTASLVVWDKSGAAFNCYKNSNPQKDWKVGNLEIVEKTSLRKHPGSTFLSLGGATTRLNVQLGNLNSNLNSNLKSEDGHEYLDRLDRSCFSETSKECTSHVFQLRTCWPPYHVLAGKLGWALLFYQPKSRKRTSMCWTKRYMVWPKDEISSHMILPTNREKSAQDVPFLQRKYVAIWWSNREAMAHLHDSDYLPMESSSFPWQNVKLPEGIWEGLPHMTCLFSLFNLSCGRVHILWISVL